MHTPNSEQYAAIHHVESPLLIIAGAGAGKTQVIIRRIMYLMETGIPADKILALTFTNKAAKEMSDRITQEGYTSVLLTTFHSLGARILRECIDQIPGYTKNFTIYDEKDSLDIIKTTLTELHITFDKSKIYSIKSQISKMKNEWDTSLLENEHPIRAICRTYQEQLHQNNAVDFDDLLLFPVQIWKNNPDVLKKYQSKWDFLLIDEYQDTNHVQYLFASLLAEKHKNICVVGDPDQSIYSWRGAKLDNFIHFQKEYPDAKMIYLEQNYRSTEHILQAANSLISHNQDRIEKSLWSNLGKGELVKIYSASTDKEEAKFVIETILQYQRKNILLSDSVIFYRTNSQSRILEDELLKNNIPYRIIGGISFYQRKEVKDLISFLRIALCPNDSLSFIRSIRIPKRGIGQKTILLINGIAIDKQIPIFTLCEHIVSDRIYFPLTPRVKQSLALYVNQIQTIQEMVRKSIYLPLIFRYILEETKYLDLLSQDDKDLYLDRKSITEELISKAVDWYREFPHLHPIQFLEELTLTNSKTESHGKDTLSLMTLHNGKGLQFSLVFIVGLEEDIFPHINAKHTPQALEEERRLFYVGMTRAKQILYITSARYRLLFGTSKVMLPSRFLDEIDPIHVEFIQCKSQQKADESGFPVGTSVRHRSFGIGVVQRQYNTSFGITYDVLFEDTGEMHSLIAKYAKLEKAISETSDFLGT